MYMIYKSNQILFD